MIEQAGFSALWISGHDRPLVDDTGPHPRQLFDLCAKHVLPTPA